MGKTDDSPVTLPRVKRAAILSIHELFGEAGVLCSGYWATLR